MITKETLIAERDSVNEAILKLKQKYSSSSTNTIFIIVEGKDDITFYGLVAENVREPNINVQLIPAGNRKKVVEAYKKTDWSKYSKKRVLFIIDRDLSDYTCEETPSDNNVYVTDNYAIENDICTKNTYLRILKYYAQIRNMNDKDEEELSLFYDNSECRFFEITVPIMALILYWKTQRINANYANVNFNNFFIINEKGFSLANGFNNCTDVLEYVCKQSGVQFDSSIDLEHYKAVLQKRHSPIHFIRGKYLSSFFVTITNYMAKNSHLVLSSKNASTSNYCLGKNEVVVKLSAMSSVPNSLYQFFEQLKLC